eukprot:15430671-Alexandrium_andersonii.AAC.1
MFRPTSEASASRAVNARVVASAVLATGVVPSASTTSQKLNRGIIANGIPSSRQDLTLAATV